MHRHLVRTEHTAWTSAALFFVSLYAGAVRGRTRGVATGGCESERWCSAGVGLRTVVREERRGLMRTIRQSCALCAESVSVRASCWCGDMSCLMRVII